MFQDDFVDFKDFLEFLETKGWVLAKIYGNNRVFWKLKGTPDEPLCFPVKKGMVPKSHVERIIKKIE